MARVLFINPVVREEDKPRHIPYGIALLAAIAVKEGHEVQVYDANAWRQGFEVLEQVFEADEWDAVCIGGLTTSYGFIKKAVRLARRKCPDSFIIVGGGFVTSMPREILSWNPEIDLAVVGEAFETFPEVLLGLDEGERGFVRTLGVCRRDPETGAPVLNPVRPNIPDLDILPWPAWDLFPLDIYFANSANLFSEEAFTSKRRMDVNGSLGCSLICRYCWHLGTTGDMLVEKDPSGDNDVVFTYGRNIRYHSPRYIVRMVKHLRQTYDIDYAAFIDENLMTMDARSGRTWLKELSELWIAEGLQPSCRRDGVPHTDECVGVHWNGTSHAGLHNAEVLKAMHRAGCSHLVYGLESFDPGILKNLGKGSTRQNNIESVRICLESGIKPIPNVIIGFPEETFDSVRNTVSALIELGITAKPHFATAYPGSEWYYVFRDSIIEQYGGDLEKYILDLGDATKITAVISRKFSPAELLGLQEIVYQKNLRLLDLAERHWGRSDHAKVPLAVPRESFNIRRERVSGPLASSG